MSRRFTSWLTLIGVFCGGCGALLGEDFKGYELKCAAGRESACAGTSGDTGASGMSAMAGDSGRRSTAGTTSEDAGNAGTRDFAGEGGTADFAGAAGATHPSGDAGDSGPGAIGGNSAAGSAGVSSVGGGAGTAGVGGAFVPVLLSSDPSPECQPEATIIPECFLYGGETNYPTIAMPAANSVGVVTTEAYDGGFTLYATKRGSPTVAQRYTADGKTMTWTDWFCFDTLPKPDRVVGSALLNGHQEVVATTRCGSLFRRVMTQGWLPWQPVNLPPAGVAVTDAAMSVDAQDTTLMYVADAGRVFVRHREAGSAYSAYGEWQEIPGLYPGILLTAGLRADSRQQVFVLDDQGKPHTAVQTTSNLDSAFGPWTDFDSSQVPPLVDIEAPLGGPQPLRVFGLEAGGALWQRTSDPQTGEFQPWQAFDGPAPPVRFVSLSGGGLQAATGTPLLLAGLSAGGAVYTLKRIANTWGDWIQP